jgi:ribonuclease D
MQKGVKKKVILKINPDNFLFKRKKMEPLPVKYITSAGQLAVISQNLMSEQAVAVDLEADSMHHFEEKVCLVQMATKKSCFIIDPLAVRDMSSLAPLFSRSGIVKVFHGADYDMRCLYRDFHISVANLFDTELAARFLGYEATSLEAVLAKHFNVVLDKKFQKKDWSLRPLPDEMIAYAANDVRYLVTLYEEMKNNLEKKRRMEWVRQHCKEIAGVRPGTGNNQAPLFAKVKGAGKLDPESLLVLEALLEFRLGLAKKKDRPAFKILGNQTLLELARNKPKNMKQLTKTGTLSPKQMQMYGGAILKAIDSALGLPKKNWPRYPKKKSKPVPSAVSRRIKELKQWRQQKAGELEIDPYLIVSKNAMKQLAENPPGSLKELDAIEDLKQWQKDMFGNEWINI